MKHLAWMLAILLVGCGGAQEPVKTPDQPAPEVEPDSPEPAPVSPEPVEGEPEPEPEPPPPYAEVTEKLSEDALPDDMIFRVEVKDYGTIDVKLYTQDAPKNITNIANLAIEGFYDGLTFHRVAAGFVVQGGDPKGNGMGGTGYTVAAEIKHKHEKGCMAMARKPDQINPKQESSGCQFYFCLDKLDELDGAYTVVGQIVEGMDVLEEIGKAPTNKKDKPKKKIVMTKVTILSR